MFWDELAAIISHVVHAQACLINGGDVSAVPCAWGSLAPVHALAARLLISPWLVPSCSGLVETSTNLASVKPAEGGASDGSAAAYLVNCSTRSSLGPALEATRDSIAKLAALVSPSLARLPLPSDACQCCRSCRAHL